ncbi:MAG: hypothetical protein M1569_00100 [Candidatus Marsarchaeota archaeon]|nr:hypothetical protein [Candidatus Marsarchaeota archaeon]MCL5412797.1 hypothetical protein [Candidatus Marsarchaeota archaeon]
MGIVDIFMRNRKFVNCSLNSLEEYSRILSGRIIAGNGKPDAIVYIERGGMVIGRLLSDALGVKRVAGINASYYRGIGKKAHSVSVGEVPRLGRKGGYLLLVDDIADTGKTLKKVSARIARRHGGKVLTCTVFYKPRSEVRPDFYVKEIGNDRWIVFEYEKREFDYLRHR